MKMKDIIIVSLIVLTATSGTLFWLSKVELVDETKAFGVKTVTKTKVVPDPLKEVWLVSLGDDSFFVGKDRVGVEPRQVGFIEVVVNSTALTDYAKSLYPKLPLRYFEIVINMWFRSMGGEIIERDVFLMVWEDSDGLVFFCGVNATTPADFDEFLFFSNTFVVNSTRLTIEVHRFSGSSNNTVFVDVDFGAKIVCYSEKPELIEYQEPYLTFIKERRHLFGDDETPCITPRADELYYSNSSAQCWWLLATIVFFLFTCIFGLINSLQEEKKCLE